MSPVGPCSPSKPAVPIANTWKTGSPAAVRCQIASSKPPRITRYSAVRWRAWGSRWFHASSSRHSRRGAAKRSCAAIGIQCRSDGFHQAQGCRLAQGCRPDRGAHGRSGLERAPGRAAEGWKRRHAKLRRPSAGDLAASRNRRIEGTQIRQASIARECLENQSGATRGALPAPR